jgi:nucleotidyltransferase-like protein
MPRPFLSSVRVRYLDRDAVLASLRELATRLGAERPEIQEIRLFGSLARGQRNPFADADLLIVLDASALPARDRIAIYKPTHGPVPMDLTVCTRQELEREVAGGNRFLKRLLGESVVLYSRPA